MKKRTVRSGRRKKYSRTTYPAYRVWHDGWSWEQGEADFDTRLDQAHRNYVSYKKGGIERIVASDDSDTVNESEDASEQRFHEHD